MNTPNEMMTHLPESCSIPVMSIIHPLLLSGLVLVGLPVLIHLLMRQKPKRLPFPALRFLQQRVQANRRSLHLRRLLLLAVRMLVIALVCLALSRPLIRWAMASRLLGGGERPVAAVFLFDTSYSMEYNADGRSRLEAARECALKLLDELPAGSRAAVFDSAERGGEWQLSVAKARERIRNLQLRHANAPVNGQLRQAYRLLADIVQEQEGVQEEPARILLVFSDRTLACWGQRDASDLQPAAGIHTMFIDVGVDEPQDLGITNLELSPQPIGAGGKLEIRATIQATGSAGDAEVHCIVDEEPHRKSSMSISSQAWEKQQPKPSSLHAPRQAKGTTAWLRAFTAWRLDSRIVIPWR